MRLTTWIVLAPALVAGVALAVANRTPVVVGFDPFNREAPLLAVQAPLFLVMFACVLTGILLGGLVTWLAGAPQRRQARLHVRELKRVQGTTPAPAAPAAAAAAATSTAVQAPAV
jgi:hypothetical protein